MAKRLRIALLIESSRAFGRDLLCGIAAYAKTYGPWTFIHQERSINDPIPLGLMQWKPDGLIVRIVDSKIGRQIRRLGIPTVDLLRENPEMGFPRVYPNQEKLVVLAVDHLLHRRLRHLAYVGYCGVKFSEDRRELFLNYLETKKYTGYIYEDGGPQDAIGLAVTQRKSLRQSRKLAAWIRGLPKPVGIFACNDMRAYQVLVACAEYGIAVPDAVSIIGVDNDPVLCELSNPPLSSIDPNTKKIGYKGAAMLKELIEGRFVPDEILVDPAGVISRHSTEILAVPDADFAEVVRYIREHACGGLTMEALIEHAGISRSTLERWFAKNLGHSPSAEITRVKVERVKELLAISNLALDEIARLVGFTHLETMFRVFKKFTGQTPGEYRKTMRT
ncbi:MAG TPA: DNA-binding transcriptional regulator [Thermoguttaceae bacterium]